MRKNIKAGISHKTALARAKHERRKGLRARVILTDRKPKLYEVFADGTRIAKGKSVKGKRMSRKMFREIHKIK